MPGESGANVLVDVIIPMRGWWMSVTLTPLGNIAITVPKGV